MHKPKSDNMGATERLAAILEAALDAIITIDQQETIVHFNRAAQKLFGYSGQEAKGRKLTDLLIPKDRRPTQSDLFGRCLSQGSELVLVQRLELVVCRSSGEEFPIEMTVVRLPAEGPVSYRCHVRDLTDQKNAEAALRASEERYRDLIENANDIIYTHDLAGNLMSWNRAGERMLGYTMEDIRGMNISQIVVPEQLERAKQMTSRKMAEGGRTAYELDVLTKDGKKLTVEISSRLASQPGQSPLVHGMARDVTERKRAEEALKEADRKKDEFLATLAHELRNPLAPIRNAVKIIQFAGDNPAAVAQVRQIIERQLRQMVRLVDDLLDVSRISRGKIDLRRERLELWTVVQDALETSRPIIDAAKHRLTIVPSPAAIFIEGDRVRLSQAISNLLNNAAKYTPEGGQISLSLECSDPEAVVHIRDNGLGIPEEMRSRIFDMFTQVDKSLHRSQGGLGIGLSLARSLVEMHGGKLEAHSDGPGKGSEFIIRLPRVEPGSATEMPVRRNGAALPQQAKRLLVVDDNADSAESLATILRMMGHEVCTAHDGPSALKKAVEFMPDVMLLDIGLPQMDGYELARRLQALPQLKKAILVAHTGWGQEEDRNRSREAGFHYHLVKPLDPDALENLLSRCPHLECD